MPNTRKFVKLGHARSPRVEGAEGLRIPVKAAVSCGVRVFRQVIRRGGAGERDDDRKGEGVVNGIEIGGEAVVGLSGATHDAGAKNGRPGWNPGCRDNTTELGRHVVGRNARNGSALTSVE